MTSLALVCLALVAFTWGGYPLLVAVLAAWRNRRRKPVAPPSHDLPRISVVVATIAPDDVIRERLRNLAETAYPHQLMDIVVAADARRQLVPEAVAAPGVVTRVVAGDPPGGKAAALNAGVRQATGDIVVFADAAQRFEAETIPRLVSALCADERLGAVSGALHIGALPGRFSAAGLYWRMERRLRRDEALLHSAVGVTGAVYAVRRSLWVRLPDGLILDDLYTPMQLALRGYRIGFAGGAIAHDARHFAPREEYRRKARTLTGVLQLCGWLPAVLVPYRNPIWVQFVTHKLLRLATPYLLLLGALGLAGTFGEARLPSWGWGLAAVLFVGPIAFSRRVREAVIGAFYMQAAMIKATLNAIRGEWDVWQS